MQSSQDEDYPWVDDNDNDAPLHHAEAEWTNFSTNFTAAGYRDGISAGKEAALQEGFDAAFADTGAPRGRELGVLRGLAAALLHLTHRTASEKDQTQGQARIREIMGKLAAVRFTDLVPPNEADSDDAFRATNGSGAANEVKGQGPSTDDLRTLRTQLETLLLEAGLNTSLHD